MTREGLKERGLKEVQEREREREREKERERKRERDVKRGRTQGASSQIL